jgi:hypothetical protein
LLGELSRDGWWYYFPVAVFAKTPAVTLIVVAAALVLWRRRPERRWLDTLSLIVPASLFLGANMLLSANPGVRYVLAIYPFLFVAAGHLVGRLPSRTQTVALLGALGALAATTVPSAPHQIAYFSHFIGGPDRGHEWLSDSNIDWGQDLGGLADWLNERGQPPVYLAYYGRFPPSYYRIRLQYLPSFIRPAVEANASMVVDPAPRYAAVSVTNLHGTYLEKPELYAWLRAREPIAKIGYSIFIYDLSAIADVHQRLAEMYKAAGAGYFARLERERAAQPLAPTR